MLEGYVILNNQKDVSNIFSSEWIPDNTPLLVYKQQTETWHHGTVVDCRSYPDQLVVTVYDGKRYIPLSTCHGDQLHWRCVRHSPPAA